MRGKFDSDPNFLQIPNLRARWRRVDGLLLLDKPSGLSSNAALQRARRALAAAKAGHTGTLDPLASGLLPICFGEATKFSQALTDSNKRYLATVRFGIGTSTADAEGEVVAHGRPDFDRQTIIDALHRFVGTITQVPPRHAALKWLGRPYYAYARGGVEIERPPREIVIHSLALIDWSPSDAIVDIHCSKGTYIRALAEDLGAALGSCAHLAALRRIQSGAFRVDEALTLDALEALDPALRTARLLPVDAAVAALPALTLASDDALALWRGQRPRNLASPGRYRCYGPEGFIGLAIATGSELRATRLTEAPSSCRPARG